MDKVQVSRAVARLQASGRVEQKAVDGDRRAKHLYLSAAGRLDHRAIVPLAREMERRLDVALSPAERSKLDDILDKLLAASASL